MNANVNANLPQDNSRKGAPPLSVFVSKKKADLLEYVMMRSLNSIEGIDPLIRYLSQLPSSPSPRNRSPSLSLRETIKRKKHDHSPTSPLSHHPSSSLGGDHGDHNPIHVNYAPFHYFEITIERMSSRGTIMVGLTPHSTDVSLDHQEEFDYTGSYLYNLDTGGLYCGGSEKVYRFENTQFYPVNKGGGGEGTVIGCGYSLKTNQIYWTKNGGFLGFAENKKSWLVNKLVNMYPLVVLSRSSAISINFGSSSPFLFSVSSLSMFTAPKIIERKFEKDENLANFYPFSYHLFESAAKYHGVFLTTLSLISSYSPTLFTLLRSHLIHRSVRSKNGNIKATSSLLLSDPHSSANNTLEINQQRFGREETYFTVELSNMPTIKDSLFYHTLELFDIIYNIDVSHCAKLSEGVFNTPLLGFVEGLYLKSNPQFNDTTASHISTHCKNLKVIKFWDTISSSSLSLIASIRSLTCIDFSDCANISDSSLLPFLSKGSLKLTSLNVSQCKLLTDKSIDNIIKSPSILSLEKFIASNCSFSEKALVHLVKKAEKLLCISVAGSSMGVMNISSTFISTLCKYRCYTIVSINLYRLDSISSEDLILLGKTCVGLENIGIGACSRVSDYSIRLLIQHVRSLHSLDLFNTKASDETLSVLVEHHPHVHTLILQQCKITSQGILNALPHLTHIQYLSLKELYLTNDVILLLAHTPLSTLQFLDIKSNLCKVEVDSLNQLVRWKPWVFIVYNSFYHNPRGAYFRTFPLTSDELDYNHVRKYSK